MKSNLLFLLLFIAPLSAQETTEKEKPFAFAAERSLKIVCLAADTGISTVWLRTLAKVAGRDGAAITPTSTAVPFSMRSNPLPYVGPAKIEFFETEPPPGPVFDEKGKRIGPLPFATTTLPSGQREVLLLFVPLSAAEQKNGLQYRLLPFDDSLDSIPWGSYRFLNFTNRSLVAFGGSKDQRFELKPNRLSNTIQPGGSKRNLQWLIFDSPSTDEKPVFSAQWLHRPNYRALVFVTESPNQRGAINVKTINEWQD